MTVMPEKISTAASYCTSGALACGGMFSWLGHIDLNTASIVIGILFGAATCIGGLWFKWRNSQAYRQALKAALRNGKMPPLPSGKTED
ncbi:hypothetical protein R84981_002784 [Carnimonas sp. R-84981]